MIQAIVKDDGFGEWVYLECTGLTDGWEKCAWFRILGPLNLKNPEVLCDDVKDHLAQHHLSLSRVHRSEET